MAERPLSPHLTIWKWGPHMAVSILHRITGQGMVFVGIPVLLWWLWALASGPEAYETFAGWVWADLSTLDWSGVEIIASLIKIGLKIALVGLTWAFFNHLASGLRHFVLDIGANYELDSNRRGSIASLVFGFLLTAAFWAAVLLV